MDNTGTVSCTLCANNLKLYVKEFLFVIFIICVCVLLIQENKLLVLLSDTDRRTLVLFRTRTDDFN